MIEISCKGKNETTDAVMGKSVAEAREHYKPLLEIPDKAKARLNGKEVKRDAECSILLNDGDKLVFAHRKMSRKMVMIAAIMAALTATAGVFAFTWTTAGVTIGGSADSEYATVAPDGSPPSFATSVFGKYRGDISSGNLFTITPDANYTGDLVVKVYLTNADELTGAYQHLNMKLELWDSAMVPVNIYAADTGHTFQMLTLDNGVATFDLEYDAGTSPYEVQLSGGGYVTNPRSPNDWNAGYEVNPLLYCEVTQR